jgi:hypothetical protein
VGVALLVTKVLSPLLYVTSSGQCETCSTSVTVGEFGDLLNIEGTPRTEASCKTETERNIS